MSNRGHFQVINMKELQEVATLGIPIYGINLSVGLAVCVHCTTFLYFVLHDSSVSFNSEL